MISVKYLKTNLIVRATSLSSLHEYLGTTLSQNLYCTIRSAKTEIHFQLFHKFESDKTCIVWFQFRPIFKLLRLDLGLLICGY